MSAPTIRSKSATTRSHKSRTAHAGGHVKHRQAHPGTERSGKSANARQSSITRTNPSTLVEADLEDFTVGTLPGHIDPHPSLLDLPAESLPGNTEVDTGESFPESDARVPPVAESIHHYLNEIGRIALLSLEEEISLARRIEEGRQAAAQLTADEHQGAAWRRALQDLVNDGHLARERLIEANLRLVVSIAKKSPRRNMDLLDIIQEGNLGLMHAVDKFDYRRGHRFSTYATWWIRHAIQRGVAEQSRTVRLPVNILATVSRLSTLTRDLEQQLSREPVTGELAEAMGSDWNPERITELQRLVQEPMYLDAPMTLDGNERFGDFIPGESNPAQPVAQEQLSNALNHVLGRLTPREATVLRLRSGLIDGRERTLEEVSAHFKLTRERIRQIEREALRKIRHCETSTTYLQDFLYA